MRSFSLRRLVSTRVAIAGGITSRFYYVLSIPRWTSEPYGDCLNNLTRNNTGEGERRLVVRVTPLLSQNNR